MTFLHLTAPYWHQMVEEVQAGRAEVPDTLRLVVCGGEQLQIEKTLQWQNLSHARLINAYGPTEATISTTFHLLQSEEGIVPSANRSPMPKCVCSTDTDGSAPPEPSPNSVSVVPFGAWVAMSINPVSLLPPSRRILLG